MELTNIGTIKDVMSRNGFTFSKALGQNFLINPTVCPKIAELGGCKPGTAAIEIGTGVGVLTKELALRCDKVLAIEIDERLKPVLAETLEEYDNIDIVFADILKTDLSALIAEKLPGYDEIVVCANLPYYITSPVIMKLLEERPPIRSVTVMVQKEAADRLCAKMGTRECGAVTAAVNYYSEPKMLFRVNRGSFIPAPNVDSAVIRLDIPDKPRYTVSDEKLFFKIVRASFAQRRKQLLNPLSAALGIPKPELAEMLGKCGIRQTARPEELKMEDIVALCETIADKK
ncbi:MAG: 16S rRNA (adenine(1518)-N(6)/adenine(1519)-N(6))-dimethyltransferase RsmA [Ruminiclostridium sp.]|nr:16S rRNA (adenine(1518)-N(6)/adenine(1519)-N(6))-dimethyltransferase RsmA [Ruminiclostridium sp.]